MPSFLVEAYLTSTPDALGEARVCARRTAELAAGVRYVRTTHVPGDETCFHLFDAPSAEVLGAAARQAGLHHERIVEAVELEAIGGKERRP